MHGTPPDVTNGSAANAMYIFVVLSTLNSEANLHLKPFDNKSIPASDVDSAVVSFTLILR